MGGTVAFFPDSLIQNFEEPPIVIHRITNKNGIVSLNYPVGTDESLEFDYQNNSLNIDFGCIDYLNDDKRKFQYRLLGQHDDWQTAYNPNRILHFYNLKHGKYELEIQSTISQMTWSGNIFSLKIEIQQAPFWMNRLFRYSLIVGVFLLMIIVLLRMRLANVTKQIQISTLETEANLSAFKFLKSQMNPHFFFNTLNAINHYILNSDVRSANRYLSLFSRLMRDMLDNSNEEFIEVHAEIDILNKYLELQKVRFNNKFTYSIESMPAALEMKIPPMFIQPFIENAVEHAFIDRIGSGQISVHFEKEEYSLKVIVEDNGIGIEKSLQMKSFGSKKSVAIQNIKHRIGILKQIYNSPIAMNIEKSNNNNEEYPGTRIVLQLPDFNLVKNSPGKG